MVSGIDLALFCGTPVRFCRSLTPAYVRWPVVKLGSSPLAQHSAKKLVATFSEDGTVFSALRVTGTLGLLHPVLAV